VRGGGGSPLKKIGDTTIYIYIWKFLSRATSFFPHPFFSAAAALYTDTHRGRPHKKQEDEQKKGAKNKKGGRKGRGTATTKKEIMHIVCVHTPSPPPLSPFLSFEWGGACCPSPSVKCQAATVASVKRKKGGYEHNGELQKGFLRK
jgi:hypothetical protein